MLPAPMKPFAVILSALPLLAALPAGASPELAKQKICMGCHAVDRKLIGPSFKDVAVRYAGQKDAPALLAGHIVNGSGGVWGAVPMPANPKVTADEARQLATWILSTR